MSDSPTVTVMRAELVDVIRLLLVELDASRSCMPLQGNLPRSAYTDAYSLVSRLESDARLNPSQIAKDAPQTPAVAWPQAEFIPKLVEITRWMLWRPGVSADVKYTSDGTPRKVRVEVPADQMKAFPLA